MHTTCPSAHNMDLVPAYFPFERRSVDGVTTIHDPRRALDEARLLAAQEEDHIGNLVGRALTVHRRDTHRASDVHGVLAQAGLVAHPRWEGHGGSSKSGVGAGGPGLTRLGHGRVDDARTDGVDSDEMLGVVDGVAPRQADDGGLGRAVDSCGVSGARLQAKRR
jgi:hypothetical protein